MSLKIFFGPYERCGMIAHRTQKLYGILQHFRELKYEVKLLPISRLNTLIIHFNDKEIFRCDIRYLMFNTFFEEDPVAQNLAASVKETCARFESDDNVPEF